MSLTEGTTYKMPGTPLKGKYKRHMVRKMYPALISDTCSYNHEENNKEKLKVVHDTYNEKNITQTQDKGFDPRAWEGCGPTNNYITGSSTYKVKPRKKENRPMGPFVVDDWFPSAYEPNGYGIQPRFFGTEENAVTNIISDNEAYITRTISQSGMVDTIGNVDINAPGSLLRTCNTHITTDENHVYVDQTITEDTISGVHGGGPYENGKESWQSQYTATFKNGQWKGSTETITHVAKREISPWWWKYLQNENSH